MCILACGWQEASWWSVITQVICWRVYNGILGRNTSRSPSSSVQPSMFSSVLFPCSLTFNFIARTVLSNCFCCRERRWERDSFCLPFFFLLFIEHFQLAEDAAGHGTDGKLVHIFPTCFRCCHWAVVTNFLSPAVSITWYLLRQFFIYILQ